jgi:hypothetical protein
MAEAVAAKSRRGGVRRWVFIFFQVQDGLDRQRRRGVPGPELTRARRGHRGLTVLHMARGR